MNFSEAMVHRARKCAAPDFYQSPMVPKHNQMTQDTHEYDVGNPQSPSIIESESTPPEFLLKNRESKHDSDQFVDISAVEERARYSSWKRVNREPEPINSVKLTILVANLDINSQLNNNQILIELNLPLVYENGVSGFDL